VGAEHIELPFWLWLTAYTICAILAGFSFGLFFGYFLGRKESRESG